ncbi:MAG TPA: hypothetical protein VE398_20195 [Acidobacteriota bacterium]|nr:hypothetical protein [Acidobacteriota bacterium]
MPEDLTIFLKLKVRILDVIRPLPQSLVEFFPAVIFNAARDQRRVLEIN